MPKMQGWVEQGGIAILSGIPGGAASGNISIGQPVGGGTPNSVLFVNSAGILGQDNPNLIYTQSTTMLNVPNITASGTISTGGNVGVGTSAPASRLDITSADNVSTTVIASFYSLSRANAVGIGFQDLHQVGTNASIGFNANGTGNILIGNVSTGAVLLAGAGGNVGLGTTASVRLDITGVDNVTTTNAVIVYGSVRGMGVGIGYQDVRQVQVATPISLNAGTTGQIFIGNVSSGNIQIATGGGNVGVGMTATAGDMIAAAGNVSVSTPGTAHRLFNVGTSTGPNNEFINLEASANVYQLRIGQNGTGVLRNFQIAQASIIPFVVTTAGALSLGLVSTNVGFFGSTPVAKPTVTGAKGGNAALGSLMTALAGLGLVTDSTTA